MHHRAATSPPPLALPLLLLAGLATTMMAPVVRAAASDFDFAHEVQRDFKMGLFPRQSTLNLQTFTGALGGFAAAAISQSSDPERPFEVDGETFTDSLSAVNRACDNQFQECQQEANANQDTAGFAVGDCDVQNIDCKSAGMAGTPTSFPTLTSSNAEFDFFCEE
ncbi:hypothetical protein UCREL1_10703 [Eutypa lata UCREL1]|uniref:Neurofilament medium polypeptide protein n=1 Tax=Eutypa lata (strain UCR-EL1) TaxID=1287681 RepID=M7SDV4_EUTLA|nr:hypothetical protein UCREL1_10703 [Eutypa lata UCREL1]